MERCYSCMNLKNPGPICEHCGFDHRVANAVHHLPMGTVLREQYEVGRVLGQGGFGITYMGYDRFLQSPVAIKEYFPTGYVVRDSGQTLHVTRCDSAAASVYEKNLNRFLREAQSLARLAGIPQVVRVQNYFAENGTAYIVMEYVRGQTLKDYVKQYGRLNPQWLFPILLTVMDGLELVHHAGLIHRDISPDNIMVLPDGGVKLLDFGAVRDYADAEAMRSTQAILKPGFAPPEQYQTRGEMGPWTDIYALCATIFYCLTGRLLPDSPERMLNGTDPDWQLLQGLNKNQLAALQRGLSLRARDRFQTVGELKKTLTLPVPPEPPIPPGFLWLRKLLEKIGRTLLRNWKTVIIFGAAMVVGLLVMGGTSEQNAQKPVDKPAVQTDVEAPRTGLSCGVSTYSDRKEYSSENLKVTIGEDRRITATISGLNIRDSYPVNDPQEEDGVHEYSWNLYIHTPENCLNLSTNWPCDPALGPGEMHPGEMVHALWLRDEDRDSGGTTFTQVCLIENMQWDSDSITWSVVVPETWGANAFPFALEAISGFEVSAYERDIGTVVWREYSLPEDAIMPLPDNIGQDGTCDVRDLGYSKEYTGENLRVMIWDDRRITVGITGLDIETSYTVNRPGVSQYANELGWELLLRSGGEMLQMGVSWYADPSDPNREITVDDMQKNVMIYCKDPDKGAYWQIIGQLEQVQWDRNSITWSVVVPESFHGTVLAMDLDAIETFEMTAYCRESNTRETRTYDAKG